MKSVTDESVFYFMHISWKWAKQRPQFLAECLSEDYLVNVIQKKDYTSKNFKGLLLRNIRLFYLFLLPYNSRFELSRILNRVIFRVFYSKLFYRSKIIWITSPELYWLLPPRRSNQTLIYDCMDDMLAFETILKDSKIYRFYREAEEKLLIDSDAVFSSSDHLKTVLKQRYNMNKNIHVINNGLTLKTEISHDMSPVIKYDATKCNLIYIGTVSKWMDWDLILESLDKDSALLYHIVGPIEFDGPTHDRIIYYGSIEHKFVSSTMSQADILIMPFVVNDLIMSVNPVKLYEYIYSGKSVISVRYPETEKFSEFVWLYSNFEEYLNLIKERKRHNFLPKREPGECKEFCLSNNWESRYSEISSVLRRVRLGL